MPFLEVNSRSLLVDDEMISPHDDVVCFFRTEDSVDYKFKLLEDKIDHMLKLINPVKRKRGRPKNEHNIKS